MARTELRSALAAREPVAFTFEDGREWEFPADVNAGAFLSFVDEYGEELAVGGNFSLAATRAFFGMVLGDRLAEVAASTSWRELGEVAWTLYFHYMGITRSSGDEEEEGGDDERPPDQA